jgi:gliding motility-associated-like protein
MQHLIFGCLVMALLLHKHLQNTVTPLVTLIAYNNFGCSDTAVKSNYVNIYDLPTASFSYTPFEPRQPNTAVNFNNLSFINNGTLTYEWNFGDPSTGAENASIQQNPTHTFSDSGNYVVTLKAISNHGCEHITTRTVRIFPHPPVPAFTYTPDQGCRPLTVTFNSDATLYADQFTWEFGDGGRSNEKNPVHTYKNASSEPYSVTLIVSGPGGREQLRKDTIITVFDLPKPNFVANPNMVYLPDAVSQFTNLSFGATKTKWLVRDELMKTVGSDTSYNTQFRFTETGKYTITMYVENEHGCMDSLTRLNLVTVDNGGNIYVPTAFTPNNDNNNELFIPTIVGVRKEDYMLRIYDRWGRRVFETNNVDEGWNGKIYGSDAVTDVYVWIVEGIFVTNEKFVRKGTVTLLR